VRLLVVSAPLRGHLLPLIPLADALRSAGHDVLIAAGADALNADTRGIEVRDIAPGFRFGRLALRTMLRHPLATRAELAGTAGTRVVGPMFAAANDGFTDAVVALARDWRPDVVVHEPLAPAGALAAATIHAPAVLVENALFDAPQVMAAVVAQMGATLQRHGTESLPAPALVITVRPPSLGGSPAYRPMRPGPGPLAEKGAPEWLLRPGKHPRILVSRSTVEGPGGGNPIPAVLSVARDVAAELVLVRPGPRLERALLPFNVRTVGWVPLPAVLPHATALVHHGGAGSVLTAYAAGVAQLAVPGPGDRKHNAELVLATGGGLAIPASEITADALSRLATDDALAAGARRVQAEIAAMPPPETLVPELVGLA
jgi:UDP:flavonoid glycosyltransferase YjiC (YdhE family)